MPRKAPSDVIEQRVTFGNSECALLKEIQQDMQTASIIKGVASAIPSIGNILIGGGVLMAGYAFYRWAGLDDPIGHAEDAAKDFALWVVSPVTDTAESVLIPRQFTQEGLQNEYQRRLNAINEECNRRSIMYQQIINHPESSPNQKAVATQDLAALEAKCEQQRKAAGTKAVQQAEYMARFWEKAGDGAKAGAWAAIKRQFGILY